MTRLPARHRRRLALAAGTALLLAGCATSGSESADDDDNVATTAAERSPAETAAAETAATETSSAGSETAETAAASTAAASEDTASATAGTGTAGADDTGSTPAAGAGDEPVDDFSDLGDVTLEVWADAGEEATLALAEEQFEAAHPNVDVVTTVRGFDDYITIIANTLQSDDAPDVAQGNQGYGVDGLLVESDLIIPLDEYAAAYGWDQRFSEGALMEYRWDDTGEFGTGSLYGVSPIAEFVGVYYNADKLAELGLEVPTTLEEFEAAAEAALAADERPIQLGNAEGWPAIHVFGLVQAAFTPPQEVRDWITGRDGATFASETNTEAAATLQRWAGEGYFGDDYNGVGNDDAVARFTEGDGLFFLGGTWNTGTFAENMGDSVGFIPMPVGVTGVPGGTGSLGLGWHISAAAEHPDLAAAFIAHLHAEAFATDLAGLGRIPAQPFENTAEGVFADAVAANDAIGGADGYTFYPDWATDTMYDTLSAGLQELLADQTSPEDFVEAVQADWEAFQAGR